LKNQFKNKIDDENFNSREKYSKFKKSNDHKEKNPIVEEKSSQNNNIIRDLNLCFNKMRIELDILHEIYQCLNQDFHQLNETDDNLHKCS